MVVLSTLMPSADRAAALAIGYGASQTVAAGLLGLRARSITGALSASTMLRLLSSAGVAAVAASGTMLWLVGRFGASRSSSAVAVVVAGGGGVAVFACLMWAASGRRNWLRLGRAE